MAEFCKECFKKELGFDVPDDKIVLSNYYDFCEGCGEMKQIVESVETEK